MTKDPLNTENSKTFQEFGEQLGEYITDQQTIGDRRVETGAPPWPDRQSAMLKFLTDSAMEMAETNLPETDPEALKKIVIWLATHSWFEGGLAERTRVRALVGPPVVTPQESVNEQLTTFVTNLFGDTATDRPRKPK